MFSFTKSPRIAATLAIAPLALVAAVATMPSAGASTTAPKTQPMHSHSTVASSPNDTSPAFAGETFTPMSSTTLKAKVVSPFPSFVNCATHPNTGPWFYHFGGSYGSGFGGWGELVIITCDAQGVSHTVVDYKWTYGPPIARPFNVTIDPGDTLALGAVQKGSKMTLSVLDQTTGQSDSVSFKAKPTVSMDIGLTTTDLDGNTYPVSDFGSQSFTQATVNKIPIAKLGATPTDLTGPDGTILVKTSPLTKKGNGFNVTYVG
jgi:hypothetical protein